MDIRKLCVTLALSSLLAVCRCDVMSVIDVVSDASDSVTSSDSLTTTEIHAVDLSSASLSGSVDIVSIGQTASPEFDLTTMSVAEITGMTEPVTDWPTNGTLEKAIGHRGGSIKGTIRMDPQVVMNGDVFEMGSDNPGDFLTGEFPIKRIQVKPFKIDRYAVTNGDFMVFKREKSTFKTEAEQAGFSWVLKNHSPFNESDVNSSLIHTDGPFWLAVRGADWSHPQGVGSSVKDKPKHPVVHVSYHDAYAFCQWADKRLPTEWEWEYVARGGFNGMKYSWGDDFQPMRSNLWQGPFPDVNFAAHTYDGVAPVDAFPAQNKFGVFDMIGNVWEWTSTIHTVPRRPNNPHAPDYTVKGGSFIDSHDGSVNMEAKNSARKGLRPRYSGENVGFRCAESIVVNREPVRHRLKDTWNYKVEHIMRGEDSHEEYYPRNRAQEEL